MCRIGANLCLKRIQMMWLLCDGHIVVAAHCSNWDVSAEAIYMT